MCLYTRRLPRVAKKDITVYKRLRVAQYNNANAVIVTPYQGTHVNSPIMTTDEVNPFKNQINGWKLFKAIIKRNSVSIESGIHAYTTEREADLNLGISEILVEATIPKGSLYMRDNRNKEIVSSKLVLGGIVRESYDTAGFSKTYDELLKWNTKTH